MVDMSNARRGSPWNEIYLPSHSTLITSHTPPERHDNLQSWTCRFLPVVPPTLERDKSEVVPTHGPAATSYVDILLDSPNVGSSALSDDDVSKQEEQFSAIPHDSAERMLPAYNLAIVHWYLFRRNSDNPLHLTKAIDYIKEARSLTDSENFALGSLGGKLYAASYIISLSHFVQQQDQAKLVIGTAIWSVYRALEEQPDSSTKHMILKMGFFMLKLRRFLLRMDLEDQAHALDLDHLDLLTRNRVGGVTTSMDDPYSDGASSQSHEHFSESRLMASLDIIEAQVPTFHTDSSFLEIAFNWTNELQWWFLRTGEAVFLNRAISLARAMHTSTDLKGGDTSVVLAKQLKSRFWHTGDLVALNEAIDLERLALDLRLASEHPHRDAACANLALSLVELFYRTGGDEHVNEAIELTNEALALRPRPHSGRPSACMALAVALRARAGSTGNSDVWAEAMSASQEAFELCPPGHPQHAFACAYHSRSILGYYNACVVKDERILALGEDVAQEALREGKDMRSWKLLTTLSQLQVLRGTSDKDVVKAIDHLRLSVRPEAQDPYQLLDSLMCISDSIWARSPGESVLRALMPVYRSAIDLLPLLAGFTLDRPAQLQALSKGAKLGVEAFSCAAAIGDFRSGLEMLEHARGVMWAQALRLSNPSVQDLPGALAPELTALLRDMWDERASDSRTSSTGDHDRRHEADSRLQFLLAEVRAMPGMERFMLGESYNELVAVSVHHPVVVLAQGRQNSFALIIRSPDEPVEALPLHCKLVEHDWAASTDGMVRWRGVGAESTSEGRGIKIVQPRSATEQMLAHLWIEIVHPVINHLKLQRTLGRSRPRVHWCPSGIFTFLPLHAAGVYGMKQNCCSDYMVSSYTPTLSALRRSMSGVTPLGYGQTSILLVSEKLPQSNHPSRVLPAVEHELELIQNIIESAGINIVANLRSKTTITTVLDNLPRANFVHLACHGVQARKDALQSSFLLGDGELTISKIMDLKLDKPFFAYLSACETAHGDDEQPDQVMHLAAAMLFAGFRSIVATMWSMSDHVGPEVANAFYAELLSRPVITADDIPYALDSAIVLLRASGVKAEEWAPFMHIGA